MVKKRLDKREKGGRHISSDAKSAGMNTRASRREGKQRWGVKRGVWEDNLDRGVRRIFKMKILRLDITSTSETTNHLTSPPTPQLHTLHSCTKQSTSYLHLSQYTCSYS